MSRMGVLAGEMEAAGLYALAAQHRIQALAVVTVSDHIVTGAQATSAEREGTFDTMVTLALEGLRIEAAKSSTSEEPGQ